MDELQQLRRVSERVAEPSAEALTRGRAALFGAIAAEARPDEAQAVAPGIRRKRAKRIGFGLLGGLAAVALCATLVVTDVVGLAGWRGGASSAAAAVLNDAAALVVTQSDPVVGPGQYLKIATNAVYRAQGTIAGGTSSVTWLETADEELYVPADRSEEWVWLRPMRTVYETFGAESEQAASEHARQPVDGSDGVARLRAPGGTFYGGRPLVSEGESADLPREPGALLNHIYRLTLGSGPSVDGEAFVFIADRMRSGLVPAELRAAFYGAAALIPGVAITDAEVNLDGRTGIAIGYAEEMNGIRDELIVDPKTGQLIGERSVLTRDSAGIPAGTTVGWTAVTTSVVDVAPAAGTQFGNQTPCLDGKSGC